MKKRKDCLGTFIILHFLRRKEMWERRPSQLKTHSKSAGKWEFLCVRGLIMVPPPIPCGELQNGDISEKQ